VGVAIAGFDGLMAAAGALEAVVDGRPNVGDVCLVKVTKARTLLRSVS